MSMLAERKQKQKWLLTGSLNRKNDWSKDSNKFGQKMLERMGWKEGKGLGRNEDGLTEHVKVAYKSNTKGVGFKDSVEWSVQQDNFKTLLKELSKSEDESNDKLENVKSLEEKSQKSRARVHYKKFTRGKDLSKYSEKDLANIFGKKKLHTTIEKDDFAIEEAEIEPTATSGVMTIQGGSMVDYFKKKTFNFAMSNVKSEDSEDEPVSYGFGFSNGFSDEMDEPKKIKKEKKTKRKATTFVSYVDGECTDENMICDNEKTTKKRKSFVLEEMESTSVKKPKMNEGTQKIKKLKKKNKCEDLDVGITNPAFEPLGKNIVIEKHALGTIVENDSENEKQILDNTDICKKKKKKSKDCHKEEKNQSFDNASTNNSSLDERDEESNQKKKKKKNKSKGLDNPALKLDDSKLEENEITLENNHVENFEVKRKKKKKSKGIDNPTLKLNDSDVSNTLADDKMKENSEVKRKNKKKSKGIDNPGLNLDDSNNCKNEKETSGIENLGLDDSNFDIMLNVTNEPIKPKDKPKQDERASRHRTKSVRFSKINQEFVFSERSPDDISKSTLNICTTNLLVVGQKNKFGNYETTRSRMPWPGLSLQPHGWQ